MTILTEELYIETKDYLNDQWSDYDDEEVKGSLECLEESKGEEISSLNLTIILRTITDADLEIKLSACEEQESGNAFD